MKSGGHGRVGGILKGRGSEVFQKDGYIMGWKRDIGSIKSEEEQNGQ